jgi:hypothetical protein
MKGKKVIFSVLLTGGIFLGMGNFGSTDAATLTKNDSEIVPYILPTTIGMSPVNVREKGSSWNGVFTLSFGGGNGTYRWNFISGDGAPPQSGTINSYSYTVKHTYSLGSLSKNTWYPRATVSSAGTDSVGGKVYLYR